jgi:hypothetical protein
MFSQSTWGTSFKPPNNLIFWIHLCIAVGVWWVVCKFQLVSFTISIKNILVKKQKADLNSKIISLKSKCYRLPRKKCEGIDWQNPTEIQRNSVWSHSYKIQGTQVNDESRATQVKWMQITWDTYLLIQIEKERWIRTIIYFPTLISFSVWDQFTRVLS